MKELPTVFLSWTDIPEAQELIDTINCGIGPLAPNSLHERSNTMSTKGALWVLAAVCVSGCTGDVAGLGDENTGTVAVSFDMSAAVIGGVAVDAVAITFEHRDTEERVDVDLAVRGTTATATVSLRPGRWDVSVQLFQGAELVGTGSASTVVFPGLVTELNVEIQVDAGSVLITVEWDQDEDGLIADLSERPIRVEISGIGTYEVHGLSRVGWDIEVIETPTPGGRTHKDPGAVSFPDIVMLDLTSSLADAEALVAWMNGPPSPLVAELIDVRGLGGEVARIALFDIVAVDGEPSIVGNGDEFTVAGVRLSVRLIELTDWSFPSVDYPPCAAPGQGIEIEGVTVAPCYADGVLDVPAVGSSDLLFLPGLREGETLYDWARDFRQEVEDFGCAGCAAVPRRSMSVIDFDAGGSETGRVNLFEVWPSHFTLFSPDVPYGHSYLFDITLQTDLVQAG